MKRAINQTMKKSIQKYSPIFLLPTIIAFVIGFLWPFVWGFALSFYKFKTLKFKEFVGLSNYIDIFRDETFIDSFWFTLLYTIVSIVIINVISFILALSLSKKFKGSTLFRTIFFLPNLVGGIVLAYVWKNLLNEVISRMFDSQLLLESKFGFWGLLIITSWQQIGYMMVIYIAGLQNVPTEQIEAAQIDGASKIDVLRKVTIPNIMPSITICLFLTLTNSFKLFDQNLALTNGLPNRETEMLALNIYRSFYQSTTNMGLGQAKAVLFLLVLVVISLIQLQITRKREHEA